MSAANDSQHMERSWPVIL